MREKECVLMVCVITLNAHNKGMVLSAVWMVCVCCVHLSLSLSASCVSLSVRLVLCDVQRPLSLQ